MAIIELLQSVGSALDALTSFLPKLVTFAAVVAAFLPPQSTGLFGSIYKYVNIIAFNFGHAKNEITA